MTAKRGLKKETKKTLIYLRYIMPVVALLALFAMLFIPSFRFIFSGKAGDRISVATLIANSWERVRAVLFGAETQTNPDIIFSRTVFILIIAFVILYIFSLAISIWALMVAMRYFISEDSEGAERSRRIFAAFIPNRIVLCLCSTVGVAISLLPYLMRPIYDMAYSESVSAVLELPDALVVGGALLLCSVLLSIICAPMEKGFGADIFEKNVKSAPSESDASEEFVSDRNITSSAEQNEIIRKLLSDVEEKNRKNREGEEDRKDDE